MKKVCVFHFPRMDNFYGYSIDSLDPAPYFHVQNLQKLTSAQGVDQMFRDRDPAYMRFIRDFVDKFRDAHLLTFAFYNPIHPEILCRELRAPVKILGFTDDPFSTYVRGLPYLWAFDGAFYLSPSYDEHSLFREALARWGCTQSYWWPAVYPSANTHDPSEFWPLRWPRKEADRRGDAFFSDRDQDVTYVGAAYPSKMDRLVEFRKRLGPRIKIHGRWPYKGYVGMLRGLTGKPVLWTRITAISDAERFRLYSRTRIGINMHLSDTPRETGNLRMYEVPAHGMMLLSDKAGLDAHTQIFVPDKEAVFYDSTKDALEKLEYYLIHHEERERIARAGFDRVHRDYDGETNLRKFLDWADGLAKRKHAEP